jgi:alkanesulfonate monooxygenase SsuD/methylene tetrahydromethanopterin reductase-like flavin-dependent oxidoreductase (luciferase family)
VKFSLFFEVQISEPTPKTEAQAFHDALEEAVFADALGYHCAWAVEHHGLLEYSHCSAPEVFLSFVAAKTRRIRVGHGVTLLPFRYNHPIRIAERIATLDILSEGRVDWGSGKSASLVEQTAFENDRATLHEQWLEALEIIPRMWKEPVFRHKGRFFDIPPIQVIPKPIQSPHPPIYAACSKPDSAALVGGLGLGALNFAIGSDDYLADKVEGYRRAVAQAKPSGRAVNNSFACTPVTMVLNDDRKACAYGFRGARFFADTLSLYYLSGTRPVGPLDVGRDFFPDAELDDAMRLRNAPGSQVAVIAGDPVSARETVQRFVDIGVDELLLVMHTGTVPHELAMESMRTFAEQVMPHFM